MRPGFGATSPTRSRWRPKIRSLANSRTPIKFKCPRCCSLPMSWSNSSLISEPPTPKVPKRDRPHFTKTWYHGRRCAMGDEICKSHFEAPDFERFARHLNEETTRLEAWFREGPFSAEEESAGFELEAWLVDGNYLPAPKN